MVLALPSSEINSAVASYSSISDRGRSCNRRCAMVQDELY
jgi:hypothetical protein